MRRRELEVVARLEVERGRLADAPDLDGVLLVEAVGRGRVRRVRDAVEQLVPATLGLREFALERGQLRLHVLELLELLGRGLALQLASGAELLDTRLQAPNLTVGGEQLVEEVGSALAGERGAGAVRLGSGGPQVDHARSLGVGVAELSGCQPCVAWTT